MRVWVGHGGFHGRKVIQMTGFDIPKGLSREGRAAAKAIVALAKKYGLEPGDSRVFYTPKEWRERGESYGTSGELVVVYDGGDLASLMTMDYGYKLFDELMGALNAHGCFPEQCTGWYSAVYT